MDVDRSEVDDLDRHLRVRQKPLCELAADDVAELGDASALCGDLADEGHRHVADRVHLVGARHIGFAEYGQLDLVAYAQAIDAGQFSRGADLRSGSRDVGVAGAAAHGHPDRYGRDDTKDREGERATRQHELDEFEETERRTHLRKRLLEVRPPCFQKNPVCLKRWLTLEIIQHTPARH